MKHYIKKVSKKIKNFLKEHLLESLYIFNDNFYTVKPLPIFHELVKPHSKLSVN